VPVILDNLIAAKRIAPMAAVFVDGGETRHRDLGCSAPFAEYVAREPVPWIRSRYRVRADPTRFVVAGVSRGGLAAAYCALKYPHPGCSGLSHSGPTWQDRGWSLGEPAR
jgi:enterochelin esterase-like enzyme